MTRKETAGMENACCGSNSGSSGKGMEIEAGSGTLSGAGAKFVGADDFVRPSGKPLSSGADAKGAGASMGAGAMGSGFGTAGAFSGAFTLRSGTCTGEDSAAERNDGSSTNTETGFAAGRTGFSKGFSSAADAVRRNSSAVLVWKKSFLKAETLDETLPAIWSCRDFGSWTAGRPGALFRAERTA